MPPASQRPPWCHASSGAEQPAAAVGDPERDHARARPDDEVAGDEHERGDRGAPAASSWRRARPSARPTETSSPPSSRPTRREPAERPEGGSGAVVHAAHAVDRRPPGETREHEQEADQGHGARATAAKAGASLGPRAGQAAQANFDDEKPTLPSYSIPNALMRERVALAIVSSEPAGWKMPVSRAGSSGLDAERDDVLDLEVDRRRRS